MLAIVISGILAICDDAHAPQPTGLRVHARELFSGGIPPGTKYSAPLTDLEVIVYDSAGEKIVGRTKTGTGGTYWLPLPPGEYRLRVRRPGRAMTGVFRKRPADDPAARNPGIAHLEIKDMMKLVVKPGKPEVLDVEVYTPLP